jgi:PleD family two-component response regulator
MFSAEDELGETEATRAGADNWIVRPLKRHELLYVVRDMLGKRALGRHDRDASSVEETFAGKAGKARLIHFELFKRLLGIELKRAQRYGFPLTTLLASVDQPRMVGRDLLAQAARAAIRDIDIPVAFGESDVLVVMPHTDVEGGRLVAERLRKRVRAEGAAASIGVVAVNGGRRVTFATLLANVKRAQRQASKNGGDSVVMAE